MSASMQFDQRIALLIPAHNEEMVLADTITGAMAAGVQKKDIYLVDDSSTDATAAIGAKLLGLKHVLQVTRSGKALALQQAVIHFKLINRYGWVQIIDADSIFSPNYFDEIRRYFQPGVAAVCGQVKSLQHNWITSYRALEYTIFQDFYKTLQNRFNMVGVMPGPATCFRSSTLASLDFSNDTLTEDFDMTVQVHHQQLGRIVYVSSALSWTQDPPSLPIYIKQVSRWYAGFFQVLKKHRVGRQLRAVDYMLLLQTVDGFIYTLQLITLVAISLIGLRYIDWKAIFAFDFMILLLLTAYAAIRMKRVDILTPMPMYYVLRILCMGLFVWAAIKVLVIPNGVGRGGVWNTGRILNAPGALRAVWRGGGDSYE
jgi:poly-beta-1,6-N-acetyl-D-glucosamine synthase